MEPYALGKTLNHISHSFINPSRSSAHLERGFCSGTFPTESMFEWIAAVTRVVIWCSVSTIFDNFFDGADGGTSGADGYDGPAALVVVIECQLAVAIGLVFVKLVVYMRGLLCGFEKSRCWWKLFWLFLRRKIFRICEGYWWRNWLLLSRKLVVVPCNPWVWTDLRIEYGYFLQLGILASRDQGFVILSPQQGQLNSRCLGLADCQQMTRSSCVGYHQLNFGYN